MTEIVRGIWPEDKPVFVRISATEWDEEGEKNADGSWRSWGIEQSILLAQELEKLHIDLIDVSSGGNYAKQKITVGPGYQVPYAEQIKKALPKLLVSSVGLITDGKQANEIIESGKADVVMLAREMLRHADFVFDAAQGESHFLRYLASPDELFAELGAVVKVPVQYERAYTRMYKQ